MKKKIFIIVLLLIFFALVFALSSCSQPMTTSRNLGIAALSMQITPAPPVKEQSEIGSTNGILIMGILIVLITTLPIFLYKKK